VLLWVFKAVTAVAAHLHSQFSLVYITAAVRAVNFNGMARLKFATVY
jgi:hypothetical protein